MKIPTIVTGMRKGELIKPYAEGLSPRDIERYYEKLLGRKVWMCKTTGDARKTIDDLILKGVTQVEIGGSLPDMCVAKTASYALQKGFVVKIPEEILVYPQDRQINITEAIRDNMDNNNYNHQFIEGVHIYTPLEAKTT